MDPPQEPARRFGSLGTYLQEIRHRRPEFRSRDKGLFDVGDIATLVDQSVVRWERTNAPAVLQDLRYDFAQNYGEILRIYHVEYEPTFQLLEDALRQLPVVLPRYHLADAMGEDFRHDIVLSVQTFCFHTIIPNV